MDDLYALDGGGAATQWQKRHAKRKARESALKLRRLIRAEAKLDLAKRTRKWMARWEQRAALAKAAGLPIPSKQGRPHDNLKPLYLDMTGRRFGRLTVIRICPTSEQGCQRCRYWLVKCDCGKTAERRVSGTSLRQGNVRSCGCLHRERLRATSGIKRAKPLSVRMLSLALELCSQGNKNAAGLLRRGAKANAREEQARMKGLFVIQLRKPRKGKLAAIGVEDPATLH